MIVRITRHPKDDTEPTEVDFVDVGTTISDAQARTKAVFGSSLKIEPDHHVEFHEANGPDFRVLGNPFTDSAGTQAIYVRMEHAPIGHGVVQAWKPWRMISGVEFDGTQARLLFADGGVGGWVHRTSFVPVTPTKDDDGT